MKGTLTIGPPGVNTPAAEATTMPASPLCWPKYRETVSWGMSTCISPAMKMAGTIRGRMKATIDRPLRAPMAGSPGSLR